MVHPTIGADTEEELARLERDAREMYSRNLLDARAFSHRLAVLAGIRRVHASGREDLARHLLHAWRANGLDPT